MRAVQQDYQSNPPRLYGLEKFWAFHHYTGFPKDCNLTMDAQLREVRCTHLLFVTQLTYVCYTHACTLQLSQIPTSVATLARCIIETWCVNAGARHQIPHPGRFQGDCSSIAVLSDGASAGRVCCCIMGRSACFTIL